MANEKLKEQIKLSNNNLNLIYEYSEQALKDIDFSKNLILTKISLVIALNTFLLCFAPVSIYLAAKILFYGMFFYLSFLLYAYFSKKKEAN